MNHWYSSIYKSFILVSVILFLITFGTTGNTMIGSLIAGYSTLTLSILMIMIVIINHFVKLTQNTNISVFSILYNVLLTTGPFALMFGIIGFLLYLTITYQNIISAGHISDSYYTFNTISLILLLLQIYLLYNGISDEKFDKSNQLSKITSSMVYLIGVIDSICVMILYIILKYYTTDG